MPQVSAYSFLDMGCTISTPDGQSISVGAGSANAKEGITIEFNEDKNRQLVGADGSVVNSLIASRTGKATVRLLKTSPLNAALAQLYNQQQLTSLLWGQNVITLTNPVTGDDYTCQGCAFKKFPKNDYAEEAGTLDWEFDAAVIDPVLGSGLLSQLLAVI